MHEADFIKWLAEQNKNAAADSRVRTGIGDDMAVVRLGNETLLIGSDMLIEGRHFDLSKVTAEQVGHKALGVCLSDCAAMGGQAVAAVVSVAKPDDAPVKVLQGVYRGMAALAKRFGCTIVGGDTCSGGRRLVIDVALLGHMAGREPVLRSTAQVGDFLYVTGVLGGSIAGRHVSFTPRLTESQWIVDNLPVHAMIDLSDGLSTDLSHICAASTCGADVYEEQVRQVVSESAIELSGGSGHLALEHALNDGEDFELLFTASVSPEDLPDMPSGIDIHVIGRIRSGSDVVLVNTDNQRELLNAGGFRHF